MAASRWLHPPTDHPYIDKTWLSVLTQGSTLENPLITARLGGCWGHTCEAAALGNSVWAICRALTECLGVFPITSVLGPAQRLSGLLKEVCCGKQFYFDDWSRHLFRQSWSRCIGSFDLCCHWETTQCMLLLYLLLLAEVLENFFFNEQNYLSLHMAIMAVSQP